MSVVITPPPQHDVLLIDLPNGGDVGGEVLGDVWVQFNPGGESDFIMLAGEEVYVESVLVCANYFVLYIPCVMEEEE